MAALLIKPEVVPKATDGQELTLGLPPIVGDPRPLVDMTDEQFFLFCQVNRDLRIERTAKGEIIIMAPAGGETSNRNIHIAMQLNAWAISDRSGAAFDSSGGFRLPNGATRSPDAAWVRRARLGQIDQAQKRRFLPLCPDFVLELCSPSDSLRDVQDKMDEYMANGAQLGWLIDPEDRSVYVYHPGRPAEHLENVESVSGDPVLPGFVLSLSHIWETGL
jgi:Uma2 family endonuclease